MVLASPRIFHSGGECRVRVKLVGKLQTGVTRGGLWEDCMKGTPRPDHFLPGSWCMSGEDLLRISAVIALGMAEEGACTIDGSPPVL